MDNTRIHYARKHLLQRTIYSDFQLKTAVNGFTAVVNWKPLLSLQRLLTENRLAPLPSPRLAPASPLPCTAATQ
jgi:hypothetical protein